MLDIDKLHDCVRQINNATITQQHPNDITTAYLHLMMGEVWLGGLNNHYAYIGKTRESVNNAYFQFLTILQEEQDGLEYSKKNILPLFDDHWYHIIANNQCFSFIDYNKALTSDFWIYRNINRVFIDITDANYQIPNDILNLIISRGADIL